MIEPVYFWTSIGLLAAGTLVIRGSVIAIAHKVMIGARARELFTFIPAAIYPALVIPMVVYQDGVVTWLMGRERLVVLILATALSLYVRNMLVILAFGLGALYLLTQAV